MTIIQFPFPPSDLSPNARVHWGKKNRAAKKYKADCIVLAKTCKALKGAHRFRLTFHPPNANRRDRDNTISQAKQLFDALSFVSGVDDSKFDWTDEWGDPVAHGQVTVEVLG